jgi:hypothetical protein
VVSRNALETLPDELGSCARLEELDAQVRAPPLPYAELGAPGWVCPSGARSKGCCECFEGSPSA